MKILSKLSTPIRFFEFFGLHHQKITQNTSKFHKWFIYCSRFFLILSVLVMIIQLVSCHLINQKIIVFENFILTIALWIVIAAGLCSMVFTFLHRKSEEKIWKIFNEIEDLMVIFLNVKFDHKRESV